MFYFSMQPDTWIHKQILIYFITSQHNIEHIEEVTISFLLQEKFEYDYNYR